MSRRFNSPKVAYENHNFLNKIGFALKLPKIIGLSSCIYALIAKTHKIQNIHPPFFNKTKNAICCSGNKKKKNRMLELILPGGSRFQEILLLREVKERAEY